MRLLVSIFLVPRLNDPRPDQQEEFRRKLEPEANEWLGWFFKGQSYPKSKEVTSVAELGELIGEGKTPSTLLQALGGTGRAICS